MREQYPEEMTIVLQHQFWDLKVTENGFEVGLSFGGVPEKLLVPFAAIKSFFDPSVQFGLQFEEIGEPAARRRRPKARKGSARCRGTVATGKDRGATRPPAEHKAHTAGSDGGARCRQSRAGEVHGGRDDGRRGSRQVRGAAKSYGSTASARNKETARRRPGYVSPVGFRIAAASGEVRFGPAAPADAGGA